MTPEEDTVNNIVGKRENAGYTSFFSKNDFYPVKDNFPSYFVS